jgi:hypothetical protein
VIEDPQAEIDRLRKKIAQLYEGAEKQKQHIKRLEEAGDAMHWAFSHHDTGNESVANAWRKAKEAKP